MKKRGGGERGKGKKEKEGGGGREGEGGREREGRICVY